MAQYVQLPNGSLFEVRAGESAHQAFLKAQQQYPELFPELAQTQKPEGGFGAAFSAGLSRLGGEAALTAGKAGILDLAQAEEIYRRQQKKAEQIFKPTEAGWTEAPFQKLKEIAGGSAAYMLGPAAAGIGAAFAPVAAPGLLGAGLAGLTSLGQYTGSNIAAQMEEGKKGLAETSGAAAVGAAVPQAALDVLSLRMMPGVKRLFGSVGKEVTEDQAKALAAQTLKQKIGDYTAATGLSMGVEGATEVAQDMLQKFQAGASLSDPKAREDYLENLIGGAALAGVLGPFGRGFERAGVAARGRELEEARLKREAEAAETARQAELAARQEAAGKEAMQQFGTLFPDLGPVSAITGTPEAAQRRLAQIEQEAEAARQAKDVDTLVRLQRERTALEAQLGEQPTPEAAAFEQRRTLEQQLSAYQNLQVQLIEQVRAAPSAVEKRPILEKLVQVQKEIPRLEEALQQQAVQPKKYEALLKQEKAALTRIRKAEETGDAAAQLRATADLEALQKQLGLFGQDAYDIQQQFEKRQAEAAAAAEANKPKPEPLLLTDQRGATPIQLGFNLDTYPTPPRVPQDYLQGTLFGPEQRVAVPARTEMTVPELQQTIARLDERPDLKDDDRALLEQVKEVATLAPGLRINEVVQERLRSLRNLRSKIESDLLARGDKALKADEEAAAEAGVAPEEVEKLTDSEKLKILRQLAAPRLFAEKRLGDVSADLPAQRGKYMLQGDPVVTGLVKRLDRLDKIEADFEKRLVSEDKTPRTLIEKLSTPGLRQRINDWLSDTSRGLDNTNSRRALEEELSLLQTAPRGEKEALMTTRRRIATPEERRLLGGKKTVVERVPTAVTIEAQQPDLFAGTEAAGAVEFETPKEFQQMMASEALQKKRTAEAERGFAAAQEVGPPTPQDVQRYKKLLQPTAALLNRQTTRLRGFVANFSKKLETYKGLLRLKTEEDDARLLAAKQQQAEVLAAIQQSLFKDYGQYLRAVLETQKAQETYDGLQDFYKNAETTFDTLIKMSDEWAGVSEAERARFKEGLEARQNTFSAAVTQAIKLRNSISTSFKRAAPSFEGEPINVLERYEADVAADEKLQTDYAAARQAMEKARNDLTSFVIERAQVRTPSQWRVTDRDFRQFLRNDAELTDLLVEQSKVVKKWQSTAAELKLKLDEARTAAENDPVWAAFLKEAQDAVDAATKVATEGKLRAPEKLMASIRATNTQIRNLENQKRAATAEQEQKSRTAQRAAEARQRAEKQAKTQADIRAENLRLEREAEARTRVTFEELSPEKQKELDAAKQQLDTAIKNKQAAIEQKQNQTRNFRLSPELQKAVADGKKTKADAVEEQRTADLKKISAMFDEKIERLQATIRAIRGVSRPSERREAQARQTQELQRQIGKPAKMSEEMQEALLTDAEKKAIDDGTKTLEQVLEDRRRVGRTGPTMVDVRTGRVSESRRAVSEAESIRLSKAEQDATEARYRNSLLQFAKANFETDLSALDTDALEYEILRMQTEADVLAELRRPATAKEQKKTAKEAAEGLDNPLNRIISHDYASRENTPLDDATADAVGKGNLVAALTSLAENGSTPFVRMVAKRLLPMVENTKLTSESLTGKGGEYDPATDTVTLNKDALTEEDLIHEPVHAATIGVIDAKPDTLTKEQLAARTALEQLYAKMQARPEFKDEYGNVSFKEFVSELLSNQQVRDKIDQTKGLLRRIYEGFLRMLGIEPTTLSDKAVEQAFAMFSPSTVRVDQKDRLASIARGVFPGTSASFSTSVPKSISDMVNRTIARNATLGDKVMANLTGLRMRTFIADQWAPIDALLKMGVAKGAIKYAQSLQMQVYMRLFSNMQEYTNSALINGVPELRTDNAGIRTIEGGDAKANGKTIAAALGKARSALGNEQAVERTFTLWMATLRAKQDGVGLDKLNMKNPPTAKELADMEQWLQANPTVKDAFEEARALYKQHNKRLLNLQVQSGAMSQDVADELGKGDYVGFYRVDNNGVVNLMLGGSRPVRVGNIIDQPYLKELVGSDQQILPFFASMAQNTSLNMSIALKNMQHKNTAYMFQDLGLGKIHSVPEGKEVPVGKLRFKQDGKDYWFAADEDAFGKMDVPFDLVMQGLQGVKTAVPALVRSLAVPADILRKAVRRIPTYTLRQTIRDPMHAWMTTGGNFVPVLSTWKELYKGMTGKSPTQLTLKEAAVVGNSVYSGDTENVAQMLRDLTAEPSKFSNVMQKLDELAMRGEAATRAVLYDNFRKKGMSHVEALLNTAEAMNFSRRGTSASLHWLAQLTPFFNAQIQGMDAVYRSLKGDTTFEEKMNARNVLLKRGALMAAGTMAYALMMEDDETYKNATPAERYGNWFVRVPGTDMTVRVPIPFELGLIFKSIPEAFINTAFGDTKSSEAVKALAKQVYMSSPFGIPTAVKGPLEVFFNYNMYTDQPIETERERSMDPDQRYRAGTTELANLLGKTGILSPVQIDHLVRSYTGSMGIIVLSTANLALRPMSSQAEVEKPDMSLTETPVIGTLFQPTTGRGLVNAAFEDMARYQRAAMTYKNLAASDPAAAQEYANKYSREIALSSTGGAFRQQMGEFAQYKRFIAASPNLTGAQKREQIEAIKKQEIELARQFKKIAA